MRQVSHGHDFSDFDAVRLAIAGKQDILDWSHGEVLKPETINYRTQKPEKDGLFCERIFGPTKDINPHDSRFKGIRSREAAVDKNGEVVTKAIVRRERMGHINLAAPAAHVWFLRGASSPISQISDMTVRNLERVTYFAAYLITDFKTEAHAQAQQDLEADWIDRQTEIKKEHDLSDKETKLPTVAKKALEAAENEYKDKLLRLNSLSLHGIISETEYRDLPEEHAAVVEVSMGGEAILKMLQNLDIDLLIEDLSDKLTSARGLRRKKVLKRLRVLEGMKRAGIKPEDMCLQILPVIPPDLRPMVQLPGGRFATSDLNDLYRRVINRNNRLKKLHDLKAPEIICRNEKRMLQESVDALVDNNSARGSRATSTGSKRRPLKSLADIFKGKHGRLRRNLLGKAVDYSGRSVIVPGPNLDLEECGLPKMMALELFKPFVIGQLIEQELAHNIRAATRLIETKQKEVWDALDKVIDGKYVLLNRAPTLHRLSIQAFKPKLIEGKAIRIHPLVCSGFSADFDGDQMAVHLPLSTKAQQETRDLIVVSHNLFKPGDGSSILHFEQDFILGSYYLTYDRFGEEPVKDHFAGLAEAIFAYDQQLIKLQTPIKLNYRGSLQQTTLGRVLFNEVFPEDFPFQNKPINKKTLKAVVAEAHRLYGNKVTADLADKLKDLLFEFATQSAISLSLADFSEVDGVDKLLEEGDQVVAAILDQYNQGFITGNERYRLVIQNWRDINESISELVVDQVNSTDNSASFFVVSGARGNERNIKSITSSLGVMDDAAGQAIEMPVKGDLLHGLSTIEYFIAARGSRKTVIDKALGTAEAGYLTRRLVFVAQDLFTVPEGEDDPGLSMYRSDAAEIGVSFASRLVGRFLAAPIKLAAKTVKSNQIIDQELGARIEAEAGLDEIKIMSVLTTPNLEGIPVKSYGLDPATGKLVGSYLPIGVVAAQSVGEPSTQLKLDSIHRAEIVDLSDEVNTGLNRIEELFEVRGPRGIGHLAPLTGKLKIKSEGDYRQLTITANANQILELALEGREAKVKHKAKVKRGGILATSSDGALRPLLAPVAGQVSLEESVIKLKPAQAQTFELTIPSFKQLTVEDNQTVSRGQRLTGGSLNLQELLSLRGIQATQRYILTEASKIFALQGHYVDKHLEVVIRQMFSRVQIDDPGETDFISRDIVGKTGLLRLNQELEAAGKRVARFSQLLLSITKVNATSDSFLAAASCQNTTRILIDAAISGRVDHLKGLKENVILGQKIPVGTGSRFNATEPQAQA